MLKMSVMVFGIVMFGLGVLGFVPGITTPDGHLLGIFRVNAEHNLVHVVAGIAAILCGMTSEHASRLCFQVLGVVYALVTLLGFIYGNQPIFGILAHNMPDAFLHLLFAIYALYMGFSAYSSLPTEGKLPRDQNF